MSDILIPITMNRSFISGPYKAVKIVTEYQFMYLSKCYSSEILVTSILQGESSQSAILRLFIIWKLSPQFYTPDTISVSTIVFSRINLKLSHASFVEQSFLMMLSLSWMKHWIRVTCKESLRILAYTRRIIPDSGKRITSKDQVIARVAFLKIINPGNRCNNSMQHA